MLSLWSMFVNCHQFLSSLYIPWESCVWRLAGLLTDICLYLWIRSPGVFLDTYCQRFGLTSSFSYCCSQEITPCSTLPAYPTLPASNNSHDHSLTYKDHCTKHWQTKMSFWMEKAQLRLYTSPGRDSLLQWWWCSAAQGIMSSWPNHRQVEHSWMQACACSPHVTDIALLVIFVLQTWGNSTAGEGKGSKWILC